MESTAEYWTVILKTVKKSMRLSALYCENTARRFSKSSRGFSAGQKKLSHTKETLGASITADEGKGDKIRNETKENGKEQFSVQYAESV